MTDREHHLQDAAEFFAVFRLQKLAEEEGVAIEDCSEERWREFTAYLAARSISLSEFAGGKHRQYHDNVERHIPVFFTRLLRKYASRRMRFSNVEVAYRRRKLKADILIEFDDGSEVPLSLKNYRNSAAQPQLSSGTFNSFLLNFVFESGGIGTHIHPVTGRRFKGSNIRARTEALRAAGRDALVPVFAELDRLNAGMRERFADGPEFEFLDEPVFDLARKQVGTEGADLTMKALSILGERLVRQRIVQMVGLDGVEEALMFDPTRYTDSLTVPEFGQLLEDVTSEGTGFAFERDGQSIRFRFVSDQRVVLELYVPFTINKNGAWISGEPYDGTRYHQKERMALAYGQRRPKKSRELATSINTWVNFAGAGIFVDTLEVA